MPVQFYIMLAIIVPLLVLVVILSSKEKNLNSIKKCLIFSHLINLTESNYAIERIILNVETTFRRF